MFLFSESCSNVNKQFMFSNNSQLCSNKLLNDSHKNKKQQYFTHRSYNIEKKQTRGKISPKKNREQKISLKDIKQKHSVHKYANNRTAHSQIEFLQSKNTKNQRKNQQHDKPKINQHITYATSSQNKSFIPVYSQNTSRNKIIHSIASNSTFLQPYQRTGVNPYCQQQQNLKKPANFECKQFYGNNFETKGRNISSSIDKELKSPLLHCIKREPSRHIINDSPQKDQTNCLRISFNGKQYLSGLKTTSNILLPIYSVSSQPKAQLFSKTLRNSTKVHPVYNLFCVPVQKSNKLILEQKINPQQYKNEKSLSNSQNICQRLKTQPPEQIFQSHFMNSKANCSTNQNIKKAQKKDNITQKKNKVIKKESFRKPFPDLSKTTIMERKQSQTQVFRPFPTKQTIEKINGKDEPAQTYRLNTNNSDLQLLISFNNDLENSQMRPPLLQAKLALSQIDPNQDNHSDNGSIVLYQMTKDNKFSQILQSKHYKAQQVTTDNNFLSVNYNFKGGPAFMTSLCGNDTDRSNIDSRSSFQKVKTYSQNSQEQMHIQASSYIVPTEIPYNSMKLSSQFYRNNLAGQLTASIVRQN